MKKFLFILSCVLVAGVMKADPPASSTVPKLKFATTEHDFGSQVQGKPIAYEFEFTNTGTDPVVLENVKASCGCTTPTWTKEPVLPGKKGTIKAQYNMAREGVFRKSITVTTKDGENIVLYISGNAVAQKQGVDEAEGSMMSGKGE